MIQARLELIWFELIFVLILYIFNKISFDHFKGALPKQITH